MSPKFIFLPKLFKNRVFFIIAFLGVSTLILNLIATIIVQQRFFTKGIKQAANSQFSIVRRPLLEALLTDDLFRQLTICQSVVDADEAINNVFILDQEYNYLTDAKVKKILPFAIKPGIRTKSYRFKNMGYGTYHKKQK